MRWEWKYTEECFKICEFCRQICKIETRGICVLLKLKIIANKAFFFLKNWNSYVGFEGLVLVGFDVLWNNRAG